MITTCIKYSEYFHKDVDIIFDFLRKEKDSNISHCILSTVEKFYMLPRYTISYFYNIYYDYTLRYFLQIPRIHIYSKENNRLYDGLVKLPDDVLRKIYSFINFDKLSKKIDLSVKKRILILDDIFIIRFRADIYLLHSLMYV